MLRAKKRIEKKELKEDPFFEKIDLIFRIYKKNQQTIIISLLSIILVVVIGWYYSNSQNKKNEEAAGVFGIAQFYLSSQQYEDAIKGFEEVNELFPKTKYGKLTSYYLGYISYRQKEFDKAIEYFEEYLDNDCNNAVVNGATYTALAKIYEDEKKFVEAGNNYKKAFEITPLGFKKGQYIIKSIDCFINAEKYEIVNKLITQAEKIEKLSALQNEKIESFKIILEMNNNK